MISKCKDCKSESLYLEQGQTHTAIKCQKCNAWLGWVKKKDVQYYTKIKKLPVIKEE